MNVCKPRQELRKVQVHRYEQMLGSRLHDAPRQAAQIVDLSDLICNYSLFDIKNGCAPLMRNYT